MVPCYYFCFILISGPLYISNLFLPLVRDILVYPLRNNNNFLPDSLKQMFHQDHIYHHPSVCETISMKATKMNTIFQA